MKDANEEVNRPSFTTLISELNEEERKSIEEWIRMLPAVFRQCEIYLRDYEAGEQTALKLLQTMNTVKAEISDARSDLIAKHKIPDFPVR